MVFWATMLSFIVSILLALVYPRNDKHMVENVPIAEAYVASFATQHQSAIDYANAISLAIPYLDTSIGDDLITKKAKSTGDSSLSPSEDKDNFIHVFKNDFYQDFIPTIAPTEGHMSTSYKLFPLPGDGYVSALVCLNKVDDKKDVDKFGNSIWGTNSTYGDIISCKTTDENTFKYVLTYGTLYPNEDESRIIFKNKRLLWEKALVKRTKNTFDCGFIETGSMTSDGKAHVMSLNAQGRKIPDNIFSFYKTYIETYNPENGVLFCITPINTPYITSGLLYHFDSFINKIDENTSISHNENMTDWTNIVSPNDVISIEGETNTKWHPMNSYPLGLRGKHHLTLDTWDESLDASSLGSSFTLSFVINFIKQEGENIATEMPVFGSTQSNIYPRLNATYDRGTFKITLMKDEWFTLGQFKINIPQTETTAITYVVTPSAHQLYINGNLIKTEPYYNNFWFTSLKTTNLTIGADAFFSTTKLSADIYNIKVYNRALTEKEIQYNLKTDKSRFKF